MCVAAQSCVNKEDRRGLGTQPWWVPVLVMTVDEVRSPTLTTCGLPVRKSYVHATVMSLTLLTHTHTSSDSTHTHTHLI